MRKGTALTVHITIEDDDDRPERMVRDPDRYFADARRRRWLAWAAVYLAGVVVWLVLDTPANPGSTAQGIAAAVPVASQVAPDSTLFIHDRHSRPRSHR